VGTVSSKGTVQFSFEEVHESDVPDHVQQRYPENTVQWCFQHNSQNIDPTAPDINDLTPRCTPPQPKAAPPTH
jgi:hypothetical protein